MNETRFLKWIIIVLLLLDAGILGYLWLHGDAPHPHGGPPGDAARFISRELNLTPQQSDAYRILRTEHHERIEDIRRQTGRYRHQLFSLLKAPVADSLQVAALADSVAAGQRQTELVTFYHFQQVRRICNPQQQQRFDAVIEDALEMMAPHPPGR